MSIAASNYTWSAERRYKSAMSRSLSPALTDQPRLYTVHPGGAPITATPLINPVRIQMAPLAPSPLAHSGAGRTLYRSEVPSFPPVHTRIYSSTLPSPTLLQTPIRRSWNPNHRILGGSTRPMAPSPLTPRRVISTMPTHPIRSLSPTVNYVSCLPASRATHGPIVVTTRQAEIPAPVTAYLGSKRPPVPITRPEYRSVLVIVHYFEPTRPSGSRLHCKVTVGQSVALRTRPIEPETPLYRWRTIMNFPYELEKSMKLAIVETDPTNPSVRRNIATSRVDLDIVLSGGRSLFGGLIQMFDSMGRPVGSLKLTLEFMLERIPAAFVTCTGVISGDEHKRVGRPLSPVASHDHVTRPSDTSPPTPAQRGGWPAQTDVVLNFQPTQLPASLQTSELSTFQVSESSNGTGPVNQSHSSGQPREGLPVVHHVISTSEQVQLPPSSREEAYAEEIVTLEQSLPIAAACPESMGSSVGDGHSSLPAVDTIVRELIGSFNLNGDPNVVSDPDMSPNKGPEASEVSPGGQMAIVTGDTVSSGGQQSPSGTDLYFCSLQLDGRPQIVVPHSDIPYGSSRGGIETPIVLSPIAQLAESGTSVDQVPPQSFENQVLSSIGLATERSPEPDNQRAQSLNHTVFATGTEGDLPLGELGSSPDIPSHRPVVYNIASVDPTSVNYESSDTSGTMLVPRPEAVAACLVKDIASRSDVLIQGVTSGENFDHPPTPPQFRKESSRASIESSAHVSQSSSNAGGQVSSSDTSSSDPSRNDSVIETESSTPSRSDEDSTPSRSGSDVQPNDSDNRSERSCETTQSQTEDNSSKFVDESHRSQAVTGDSQISSASQPQSAEIAVYCESSTPNGEHSPMPNQRSPSDHIDSSKAPSDSLSNTLMPVGDDAVILLTSTRSQESSFLLPSMSQQSSMGQSADIGLIVNSDGDSLEDSNSDIASPRPTKPTEPSDLPTIVEEEQTDKCSSIMAERFPTGPPVCAPQASEIRTPQAGKVTGQEKDFLSRLDVVDPDSLSPRTYTSTDTEMDNQVVLEVQNRLPNIDKQMESTTSDTLLDETPSEPDRAASPPALSSLDEQYDLLGRDPAAYLRLVEKENGNGEGTDDASALRRLQHRFAALEMNILANFLGGQETDDWGESEVLPDFRRMSSLPSQFSCAKSQYRFKSFCVDENDECTPPASIESIPDSIADMVNALRSMVAASAEGTSRRQRASVPSLRELDLHVTHPASALQPTRTTYSRPRTRTEDFKPRSEHGVLSADERWHGGYRKERVSTNSSRVPSDNETGRGDTVRFRLPGGPPDTPTSEMLTRSATLESSSMESSRVTSQHKSCANAECQAPQSFDEDLPVITASLLVGDKTAPPVSLSSGGRLSAEIGNLAPPPSNRTSNRQVSDLTPSIFDTTVELIPANSVELERCPIHKRLRIHQAEREARTEETTVEGKSQSSREGTHSGQLSGGTKRVEEISLSETLSGPVMEEVTSHPSEVSQEDESEGERKSGRLGEECLAQDGHLLEERVLVTSNDPIENDKKMVSTNQRPKREKPGGSWMFTMEESSSMGVPMRFSQSPSSETVPNIVDGMGSSTPDPTFADGNGVVPLPREEVYGMLTVMRAGTLEPPLISTSRHSTPPRGLRHYADGPSSVEVSISQNNSESPCFDPTAPSISPPVSGETSECISDPPEYCDRVRVGMSTRALCSPDDDRCTSRASSDAQLTPNRGDVKTPSSQSISVENITEGRDLQIGTDSPTVPDKVPLGGSAAKFVPETDWQIGEQNAEKSFYFASENIKVRSDLETCPEGPTERSPRGPSGEGGRDRMSMESTPFSGVQTVTSCTDFEPEILDFTNHESPRTLDEDAGEEASGPMEVAEVQTTSLLSAKTLSQETEPQEDQSSVMSTSVKPYTTVKSLFSSKSLPLPPLEELSDGDVVESQNEREMQKQLLRSANTLDYNIYAGQTSENRADLPRNSESDQEDDISPRRISTDNDAHSYAAQVLTAQSSLVDYVSGSDSQGLAREAQDSSSAGSQQSAEVAAVYYGRRTDDGGSTPVRRLDSNEPYVEGTTTPRVTTDESGMSAELNPLARNDSGSDLIGEESSAATPVFGSGAPKHFRLELMGCVTAPLPQTSIESEKYGITHTPGDIPEIELRTPSHRSHRLFVHNQPNSKNDLSPIPVPFVTPSENLSEDGSCEEARKGEEEGNLSVQVESRPASPHDTLSQLTGRDDNTSADIGTHEGQRTWRTEDSDKNSAERRYFGSDEGSYPVEQVSISSEDMEDIEYDIDRRSPSQSLMRLQHDEAAHFTDFEPLSQQRSSYAQSDGTPTEPVLGAEDTISARAAKIVVLERINSTEEDLEVSIFPEPSLASGHPKLEKGYEVDETHISIIDAETRPDAIPIKLVPTPETRSNEHSKIGESSKQPVRELSRKKEVNDEETAAMPRTRSQQSPTQVQTSLSSVTEKITLISPNPPKESAIDEVRSSSELSSEFRADMNEVEDTACVPAEPQTVELHHETSVSRDSETSPFGTLKGSEQDAEVAEVEGRVTRSASEAKSSLADPEAPEKTNGGQERSSIPLPNDDNGSNRSNVVVTSNTNHSNTIDGEPQLHDSVSSSSRSCSAAVKSASDRTQYVGINGGDFVQDAGSGRTIVVDDLDRQDIESNEERLSPQRFNSVSVLDNTADFSGDELARSSEDEVGSDGSRHEAAEAIAEDNLDSSDENEQYPSESTSAVEDLTEQLVQEEQTLSANDRVENSEQLVTEGVAERRSASPSEAAPNQSILGDCEARRDNSSTEALHIPHDSSPSLNIVEKGDLSSEPMVASESAEGSPRKSEASTEEEEASSQSTVQLINAVATMAPGLGSFLGSEMGTITPTKISQQGSPVRVMQRPSRMMSAFQAVKTTAALARSGTMTPMVEKGGKSNPSFTGSQTGTSELELTECNTSISPPPSLQELNSNSDQKGSTEFTHARCHSTPWTSGGREQSKDEAEEPLNSHQKRSPSMPVRSGPESTDSEDSKEKAPRLESVTVTHENSISSADRQSINTPDASRKASGILPEGHGMNFMSRFGRLLGRGSKRRTSPAKHEVDDEATPATVDTTSHRNTLPASPTALFGMEKRPSFTAWGRSKKKATIS